MVPPIVVRVEDDINDIDPTSICRSVCVTGFQAGTKSEDLIIHFQRKKYGGGDVEKIIISKKGTAVITFDNPEVVSSVLERKQDFEGVVLTVERYLDTMVRNSQQLEVFQQRSTVRSTANESTHQNINRKTNATYTDRKVSSTSPQIQSFEIEPKIAEVFGKAHDKELRDIETKYHVEIPRKAEGNTLCLKPKDECSADDYEEACQQFISLYQKMFQLIKMQRFSLKSEKKIVTALVVIGNISKKFPVSVDICKDRGHWNIYGAANHIEEALKYLKQELEGVEINREKENAVDGKGKHKQGAMDAYPSEHSRSDRNPGNRRETFLVVPSEINLRGPLALEAYNKALAEGKACVKRVPVMLIGQDRSGKTSLKNSLKRKPFNNDEESTVGIDVDPSYFKVSNEVWRPEENDQAKNYIDATSFEHHAARLVADKLKEVKRDAKSMQSENSEFKKESSLDASSFSSNNAAEIRVESAPSSETARDAIESSHTETSSDPSQKRKEHSLLAAKIPDEIAILIKKLAKEVEKVQGEEEIYSILWDFGGQSVYYTTHPLFITTRGMYLLVYDLSRDPYALAEPVVKQGKYQEILDNHGAKSNLDYLNFWMTSIASLASQDEDQNVRSGRVQVNTPPVFLVCTHADKPYGGANPLALARKVFGFLQTKPYRNQLYNDVFVVDNTKSGTESECPEVVRLRENVLAVAKELPQMKESIPIKWLKYEKALHVTAKEGHKWISFEIAKRIASEVCQIDDDKELSTLLDFLHDQRILIHFDDTAVLNNLVVLDPQWLVDVFKKVITVKPCHQQEKEFEELWSRLECKGILEQKLLEHVWGPLFDQQETSASLIGIMEKFSLLCPWSSPDASGGKQYLVPSMLMTHPPQDIIKLVASAQIPSLFLKFESGQIPPGLFPRLVLQFFQWGQGKFWSSENPQLYHNVARFYTSGDEDCSVILLCHSSSIEVVVHRGNLSDGLEESLQSKLNISANTRYDAFEVACSRTVHRQLGLMLECMRKEFCWLKNMTYEVAVMCPVCCQGGVRNYCCTHHKQFCEQEECLHFWTESDLRSSKQFIRCRKCVAAQSDKAYVKRSAPWIETSDEQLTIDTIDGSLLVPDEGSDEKLLALPSKVLETLFSQQCDSKEVVLQLKQFLQFDQASLEQPDPGTKRLIRCLAIKAKQSNRLDVFDYLREITPAGTTGPRLRECLDIRRIPFRQMRALTVRLSGGDEWKIVAEELGLNADEIRYLDNRTQNPCEALLAYIAQHCYRSVGYLYSILNKCGFPLVADIL